MRLLDLFCGAGGCSVGYHRAGFTEIVGVDNRPMPRYPFTFVQGDALELLGCLLRGGYVKPSLNEGPTLYLADFDAIHASPPCQEYCHIRKSLYPDRTHPDLVGPVRSLLTAQGVPWVIENVPGAPLLSPVMLCGSMFKLDVRRHRLFESNVMLMSMSCLHAAQKPRFRSLDRRQKSMARVVGVHGSTNYKGELELWKRAMAIDWMSRRELSQAIPPAYTEFIGRQLIAAIQHKRLYGDGS